MARSSTCCTPPQNLFFGGEDELATAASTKGNNTPAMSHALILATAPPVISAFFSMAQYLEDDFQRIVKTVLDSRPLVCPSAPAPAPQQYKGPRERPLKARFLDVYWGKIHLKYYNFF